MASPVGFEGCRNYIRAPKGMSSDECIDLPCHRTLSSVLSCWRLTDDELKKLAVTGVLWVEIMGDTMLPLRVLGHSPILFDGREPVAEPYIPPAPRTEG